MKLFVVILSMCLSACATRHVSNTYTMYADCHNKQRLETKLAKDELLLSPDDIQGRRLNRELFWQLQEECQ